MNEAAEAVTDNVFYLPKTEPDCGVPDSVKSELRQKYPNAEFAIAESGGHKVILRSPTMGEHDMYVDMIAADKKRGRALRQLFRNCCVWPDREAVDAMLNKKPGLGEVFGFRVAEMAGQEEATVKKF